MRPAGDRGPGMDRSGVWAHAVAARARARGTCRYMRMGSPGIEKDRSYPWSGQTFLQIRKTLRRELRSEARSGGPVSTGMGSDLVLRFVQGNMIQMPGRGPWKGFRHHGVRGDGDLGHDGGGPDGRRHGRRGRRSAGLGAPGRSRHLRKDRDPRPPPDSSPWPAGRAAAAPPPWRRWPPGERRGSGGSGSWPQVPQYSCGTQRGKRDRIAACANRLPSDATAQGNRMIPSS